MDRLAGREVAVVSLHPRRLDDIWGDVRRVAATLHRQAAGEALVAGLLGRLDRVELRAAAAGSRPPVVSIEWLDPVMLGGTWMPELIVAAGGEPLGVAAGEGAPTLDLAALRRLEPEVVVIKPCGYPVERTLAELDLLPPDAALDGVAGRAGRPGVRGRRQRLLQPQRAQPTRCVR
jgi:iron complex transport system substrate-binding protein